jgi:thiol-disulfide isomerase/thioredoxin
MGPKQPWFLALCIIFILVQGYAKYNALPALSNADRLSMDASPDRQNAQIDLLSVQEVETAIQNHSFTVISFWETWCEPCLEEMPALSKMMSDPSFQDVGFIGIFAHSTADDVAEFVNMFDVNIPMHFDQEGQWSQKYDVTFYPTTFVVNAQAEVLETFRGFRTDSKEPLAELENKLIQLQEGKSL